MKQELGPTSLDIIFKCVGHPLAVTGIKCQGRVSMDTVSAHYSSVLRSWRNMGFAKIISWGEHFLFPFFMLVPKERPKQRKTIADVKNYLAMVTEGHWESTDEYTVNRILVLIGVKVGNLHLLWML